MNSNKQRSNAPHTAIHIYIYIYIYRAILLLKQVLKRAGIALMQLHAPHCLKQHHVGISLACVNVMQQAENEEKTGEKRKKNEKGACFHAPHRKRNFAKRKQKKKRLKSVKIKGANCG